MPDIAGTGTDIGRNAAKRAAKVNIIKDIGHDAVAIGRAHGARFLLPKQRMVGDFILAIIAFNFGAETIAIAPTKAQYATKAPFKINSFAPQFSLVGAPSAGDIGAFKGVGTEAAPHVKPAYRLSLRQQGE